MLPWPSPSRIENENGQQIYGVIYIGAVDHSLLLPRKKFCVKEPFWLLVENTGNLLYRELQFLFCCSTWIIVYLSTWQVSGSVLETSCDICLSFLQTVACFFSSHSIKRCKYHEVLASCFSLKSYREPSSSWSAYKQMWILKTLREIYLLRSGNWVPADCLTSNPNILPQIFPLLYFVLIQNY